MIGQFSTTTDKLTSVIRNYNLSERNRNITPDVILMDILVILLLNSVIVIAIIVIIPYILESPLLSLIIPSQMIPYIEIPSLLLRCSIGAIILAHLTLRRYLYVSKQIGEHTKRSGEISWEKHEAIGKGAKGVVVRYLDDSGRPTWNMQSGARRDVSLPFNEEIIEQIAKAMWFPKERPGGKPPYFSQRHLLKHVSPFSAGDYNALVDQCLQQDLIRLKGKGANAGYEVTPLGATHFKAFLPPPLLSGAGGNSGDYRSGNHQITSESHN